MEGGVGGPEQKNWHGRLMNFAVRVCLCAGGCMIISAELGQAEGGGAGCGGGGLAEGGAVCVSARMGCMIDPLRCLGADCLHD